jgi:hypothetical protein
MLLWKMAKQPEQVKHSISFCKLWEVYVAKKIKTKFKKSSLRCFYHVLCLKTPVHNSSR